MLSLVYLSISLHANEPNNLNDIDSILNEASDIATKKSTNVDYLPSVVTVIDAQTFIDGGIQNIGEAIGMLPGIQMQIGYLGKPITTVRGFKNPNSFISDKIKILIDGIAINNEAAGTSGFYMNYPMNLVQRIEVLRGPGSTVYGAGAFNGAINIITKMGSSNKENQFYWGAGSYKNITTGGNINTSIGDWDIFSDAYYMQNDKSIDDNGKVTDEQMQDLSLGLKIVHGGFEFMTKFKSSQHGNFYARKGDVNPNQDKGTKNNYFFSQLLYKTNINNFKLEAKAKYSNRESDTTAYISNSVSDIAAAFNVVGITMNEAFYIRDHQIEENYEAEASVTTSQILSNEIVIGVGVRQANITTNDFYSSVENSISQNLNAILAHPNYNSFPFREAVEPAYWQDPTSTDIFSKTSRTISYANVQDLISVTKNIDFILGARVDNYSDMGLKYSTRAGVVYRANDKLILKILYGSGYRAPSLTERYTKGHIFYRAGDAQLSEETTQTYETVLIYKPNMQNKLSLNFFYSQLSDVIDLEEQKTTPTGYQNMKGRSSKGVEFEYFFQTKLKHNFYFNATYTEADYTTPSDDNSPQEIDQSMPDISKTMLKAMYIYHATNSLTFGTTWQYYSQTTKTQLQWVVQNNIDKPVEEQHIVDETVTYNITNSSQIRLTIKNLFYEEVRQPSYYYTQNGGVLREGQNYYLNYKYSF